MTTHPPTTTTQEHLTMPTHPTRFTPVGTLVKVSPRWPMARRGPAELEPGTRYLVDELHHVGDTLEVMLADLEGRGLAVAVPSDWLELADDEPHPVTLLPVGTFPVAESALEGATARLAGLLEDGDVTGELIDAQAARVAAIGILLELAAGRQTRQARRNRDAHRAAELAEECAR